jgi:hypothetical protein
MKTVPSVSGSQFQQKGVAAAAGPAAPASKHIPQPPNPACKTMMKLQAFETLFLSKL